MAGLDEPLCLAQLLAVRDCVVEQVGVSLSKSLVRGRADRFSRRTGLLQLPGEPV